VALWNIDVVGEYESALMLHPEELNPEKECRLRYALGLFFRNAGWHEGAAISERRALDLCENLTGNPEDISSLQLDISLELAKAYLDRGDPKNASEILGNALKMLGDDISSDEDTESTVRNFDLRHINLRNEYARALKDQGKYADAERISRITLKAATERFGTNHFATQNEMRWLAEIMRRQGKFAEAEPLYRAVINSVEASLGPESLDVAYYLNEYGEFLRQKSFNREVITGTNLANFEVSRDYNEAQVVLERAIAIIESRLGKNHSDLGHLLSNIASLHSQNGNWDKAEPLFNRSLAISEMAYGPEHPNTALSLNNFAGFLFRQGKYDMAETPYRRVLAIWLKVYGKDHPLTATSYNNLANLLRRRGKYDEAEECYAQTLQIRLTTLGPMHIDTSRTLEGYGRFMRIKGDLVAAEDFLNRSYAAKKHGLGAGHKDTIFIALARVEVLLERSNEEEAPSILKEVIELIGLENAITASNEMLTIIGGDRAIDSDISQTLMKLIAS